MEEMTRIQVIKKFFEQQDARPVKMYELKELSKSDREELAELAAVELGVKVKA